VETDDRRIGMVTGQGAQTREGGRGIRACEPTYRRRDLRSEVGRCGHEGAVEGFPGGTGLPGALVSRSQEKQGFDVPPLAAPLKHGELLRRRPSCQPGWEPEVGVEERAGESDPNRARRRPWLSLYAPLHDRRAHDEPGGENGCERDEGAGASTGRHAASLAVAGSVQGFAGCYIR